MKVYEVITKECQVVNGEFETKNVGVFSSKQLANKYIDMKIENLNNHYGAGSVYDIYTTKSSENIVKYIANHKTKERVYIHLFNIKEIELDSVKLR